MYEILATHDAYKLLAERRELGIIWQAASRWYDNDKQSQSIDRALFEPLVHEVTSELKTADAAVVTLQALPIGVSIENALEALRASQRERLRMSIAEALLSGEEEEADELLAQYAELRRPTAAQLDDAEIIGSDLLDMDATAKMYIAPGALNKLLSGGMRTAQTILFLGRPGIGKTLLSMNAVAGLLHHSYTGVYFGNEEPTYKLKMRLISRLGDETLDALDHTSEDVRKASIARGLAKAIARGADKLKFVHGVTDPAVAEEHVRRHRPNFIVLDQIRHMKSHGKEGHVENLEAASRWLREVCSRYNMLGIGVTQAGASAEGKAVLDLDDIDGSKTGVQGAFDVICAIGANETMKQSGQRMISIVRNKVSGREGVWFPAQVDLQHTKIIAP